MLSALSDIELAALLTNSFEELRRRLAIDGSDRVELQRAAQGFASTLADLAGDTRRDAPGKGRRPAAAAVGLEDTKRSAVRAALRAGVKPAQVAKHFGLSLAAVRQIAAQPR
jgi:hypothetical protein